MRHRRFFLFTASLFLTLASAACTSNVSGNSGGSGGASTTCFSPLAGPDSKSCEGYMLGLSCSFGDEPAYGCVCEKSGSTQEWSCSQSGPGSSSSAGTSMGTCHGDDATWKAITKGPLACTKNSDCCVVNNGCLSQAQVVKAADYMTAGAAWPYCDSMCNGCIAPAIQVGCVNGQCVGQDVDDATPPPPDDLRMNHCGVDATKVVMPSTALSFGCGL